VAYTSQNFIDDYNKWQYKDQMSQYDYNMALANPEIGQQIMSLKDQWNAPGATSAQRGILNSQAEALRTQYGSAGTGQYNYTGGGDGSGYNPIIPASTATTPSTPFQSQYQDEIGGLLSKIGDYGAFSFDTPAPTYTNRYDPTIQSLLGDIVNRPEFSYNKDTDPNWGAYAKQYRREGELASRDAMAAASARSGGLQSSSAATAGQQASNYYASKLSDMLPQLYQQAYDRYSNEYQMKRQALGDVYQQEQADYGKYVDDLGQYNTDRNFAYQDYNNQYNMLNNALGQYQGQDSTDYSRFFDQRSYDTEAAQYKDKLIQQSFDNAIQTRTLNENAAQQALNNQRYDTEYADQMAQQAFENSLAQQRLSSGGGLGGKKTDDTTVYDQLMSGNFEPLYQQAVNSSDPYTWLSFAVASALPDSISAATRTKMVEDLLGGFGKWQQKQRTGSPNITRASENTASGVLTVEYANGSKGYISSWPGSAYSKIMDYTESGNVLSAADMKAIIDGSPESQSSKDALSKYLQELGY
jgi:hypothetical protein